MASDEQADSGSNSDSEQDVCRQLNVLEGFAVGGVGLELWS